MKLIFLGAAHEVTGSCHLLEIGNTQVLIDCGLEQGPDLYENQELSVHPSEIDFLLVTHAHIDHTGLIPWLYNSGFRGEIYATKATTELCDIMLRDSAHIQMFEADWKNRKARRSGGEEIVPLYTMDDAVNVMKQFIPCPYEKKIKISSRITIRFIDVGHLLGSSSIEIWAKEDGVEKKIVFSGDIGNLNQPLIKNPKYISSADFVVMESTYGDRDHLEVKEQVSRLVDIIQETFDSGGNVIIPSFAVGRTQEMLYFLRDIKSKSLIKGHNDFDVYVDSPLAIEATEVFLKNIDCCFDSDAMELVKKGINPIEFPGLKLTITSQESRDINIHSKPKIIISASGMCDAGRIRHHLKHNLWKPNNTILFIGYQARGSLGRSLLDGAKRVKLFGEIIEVNARIEKLDGISGHADQDGLLKWIGSIENKPEKVFIVHGEDSVCETFASLVKDKFGYDTYAPFPGGEYDLISNVLLEVGNNQRKQAVRHLGNKRAIAVYARLVAAGQRLVSVIKKNEGGANKDLAKFTDQIQSLCDKWDR